MSLQFLLMTHFKDFFGLKRLTDKFLNVPSCEKNDCHHSHQQPGEDEAESDATVEISKTVRKVTF